MGKPQRHYDVADESVLSEPLSCPSCKVVMSAAGLVKHSSDRAGVTVDHCECSGCGAAWTRLTFGGKDRQSRAKR